MGVQLLIDLNNRSICVGKKKLVLTKRFLSIYCYLAIQRIDQKSNPEEAWVFPCELKLLKQWERNTDLSIGKQLRRHLLQAQSRQLNIIECQQTIKGPYRLAFSASAIGFTVPLKAVREFLEFTDLPQRLCGERESSFYNYVQALCCGDQLFDSGALNGSLEVYCEALNAVSVSSGKVVLLHRIARVHERRGNYSEAMTTCKSTLKMLQRKSGRESSSDLMRSKVLNLIGILHYRHRNLTESERFQNEALRLAQSHKDYQTLGYIYNGLGLVRKAQCQHQDAIGFFQRALEYWVEGEHYYGVQVAYFNIGSVYERWAFQEEKGLPLRAAEHRKIAIIWLKRCIALCNQMKVGQDSSIAELTLADVLRRSGDLGASIKYATTARKMAERAGSKADYAYASWVLAKAYQDQGDFKAATITAQDCVKKIPIQILNSINLDLTEFLYL